MKQRSGVFIDVFSGVGLGLLVGVIVGLSLTPVVSGIVGALGSVLAVFLGLQGSGDDSTSKLGNVHLNGIRIGCFGFATVVGLLFALYVRATEPFAESVVDNVARWTAAKYTPEEARMLVVYERTGIAPQGANVNPEIAAQQQAARRHALFAELNEIDLCAELDPSRLGDNVEAVLRAYRRQDNQSLNDLADSVEALEPEQSRLVVLNMMVSFMCDLQADEEE